MVANDICLNKNIKDEPRNIREEKCFRLMDQGIFKGGIIWSVENYIELVTWKTVNWRRNRVGINSGKPLGNYCSKK